MVESSNAISVTQDLSWLFCYQVPLGRLARFNYKRLDHMQLSVRSPADYMVSVIVRQLSYSFDVTPDHGQFNARRRRAASHCSEQSRAQQWTAITTSWLIRSFIIQAKQLQLGRSLETLKVRTKSRKADQHQKLFGGREGSRQEDKKRSGKEVEKLFDNSVIHHLTKVAIASSISARWLYVRRPAYTGRRNLSTNCFASEYRIEDV